MSVLNVERPDFMAEEEIRMFEDSVVRFFEQNAPPERVEKWRKDKVVERAMWTEAGAAGLLGLSTPEEYGGMGGDYRHEVILMEQLGLKGVDEITKIKGFENLAKDRQAIFGRGIDEFVKIPLGDHHRHFELIEA